MASVPDGSNPKVSVLLSVHNSALFLSAAVNSILCQTFRDFELLICDDGSSDDSVSIIKQYEANDSRIRVFLRSHQGIAASKNELARNARGLYLANMDADDICLPDRFERQVEFLDRNPDHVVVGSWIEKINACAQPIGIIKPPLTHYEIDRAHLKGHCSIWHPFSMVRATTLVAAGGYSSEFSPAEDLELWLRLAEIGKLANIPYVTGRYRLHQDAASEVQRQTQKDRAKLACERTWARRGIQGTFEATEHWRPGKTKESRHCFAIQYGWMAWNHNHRNTWWTYVLEAFRLRPFALDTWKLFFFGLLRRPGDGLLDRHG